METRPVDSWTLRPLSVGEMLDRAITLTIKNFPVLALIALVYAVPQAVFQYFGTQDQSQFFGSLVDAMREAAAGKSVNFEALLRAQRNAAVFNGWTVLLYVWLIAGLPLYSTALIYAASCRYRGVQASAGESLRMTSRHWAALIGITLVYFVIVMLVLFVLLLGSLSMIFALTLIGAGLRNTAVMNGAIVLIAVVTILMSAVIFVATMMGYIALHFAWMANVLEGAPLVRAIASSLGRIFGRQNARRAVVIACAYFILASGYALFVFGGIGLIGSIVHSNVAGVAFSTIMQTAVTAFFAAFFMVFYYDTRVRREGLDLELAAAALPAAASPAVA